MNARSDPILITVLLVEDEAAVCEDFVAMIKAAPNLRLQAAVGSLAAAREHVARQGAPDVLVVDLGLPDGEGTELVRELRQAAPATAVLVATTFGDEGSVTRALEAGAHGYLLKDGALEELARSITLVHNGESPLTPRIARFLLKRFVVPAAAARTGMLEPLTTREAQILTMISHGHSVPELAQRLHLSVHTINTHVKNIYGKLAVNNRLQAVNRGRETGQIR